MKKDNRFIARIREEDDCQREISVFFVRANRRLHQIARYVRTDPEAGMMKTRLFSESILYNLLSFFTNKEEWDKTIKDIKGTTKKPTSQNMNKWIVKEWTDEGGRYGLTNSRWGRLGANCHSISELCSPAAHQGEVHWGKSQAKNAFSMAKDCFREVVMMYQQIIGKSVKAYFCKDCDLKLSLIRDYCGNFVYATCFDCRSIHRFDEDRKIFSKIDNLKCSSCGEEGIDSMSSLFLSHCSACQQFVHLDPHQGFDFGDEEGQLVDDFFDGNVFRGQSAITEYNINPGLIGLQDMNEGEERISVAHAIICKSPMVPIDLVIKLIDGQSLVDYDRDIK
jgi:hypothetical protein